MPNHHSRSDASASRDATPGADSEVILTRRQLRERRLAEADRLRPSESAAEGEPTPAALSAIGLPIGVEIPVLADAAPEAAAAEPLTRRRLREQEALERETQEALRAEEIATLEIAEIGTAALEPDVALALEPVVPVDDAAISAFEPEPALHIALPSTTQTAPIATETMIVTSVSSEAEAPLRPGRTAPIARSSSRGHTARPPARRVDVAGAATSGSGAPAPSPRRRRGWAKAGLSGIAMAFVVAMTAVTALPTTVSVSPVDANVVNLSLTAGTTAQTQQLVTAGTASGTVDRDGYAVSDAGELQAAGYSTAQLLVGRSLAQELVNAMDSGKLVGSQPDHMKEIRWIAQGVTVADCGVDYRILEIIAIAVRNFDQVGVSDINRKCTGQIEGGGTSSMHYVDGGGHAVDFYLLDNKSLNGADAGTLKMISLLDPVMPVGSRVGQASCRASAGVTVNLTNWTEFDDSCTHMHVDVPATDAPLLLSDSSLVGTSGQ